MEDKAEKKKQREAVPQPYKLKKNVELINKDKRPFRCSECNLNFQLERDLKRHLSNAHNRKKFVVSTDKKVDCTAICEPSVGKDEDKKRKQGVEKTIFKSDKGFYKERGLKDHVEIGHESKKQYHCSKCDKCFAERSKLYFHEKVVHEGKKSYICHCGFKCLDRVKFERHIQIIHKGKQVWKIT